MRFPAWFLVAFSLWVVAEGLALGLILYLVGFTGAILLTLVTSLTGLTMLRRLGAEAAHRLRRSLFARAADRAALSREAVIDGTLSAVGSILLILPGFASDFIGLALAAPSFRLWVANRFWSVGGRTTPDVIDLAPREWSRLEEARPRAERPFR